MPLWIPITLAAAAVQTWRFFLQKQLKTAGLSTGAASFARFVFAAPLAIGLTLAVLTTTGADMPGLPPTFWAYGAVGGFCQVVATMATVALFARRNFAVGIAFTKSETLMVAGFSLLILGEGVSNAAIAAMAIGVVAVVLLSLPKNAGLRLDGPSAGLGLLAGGCFAMSAIGYRGATLALGDAPYFLRAAVALAAVTTMQSLGMAVWLRWREPGALQAVARAWRVTAAVGVTGMLGSLGWFTAFTLQNAAIVRAVGQVELIFSILVSAILLSEMPNRRELLGIALLAASVVGVILSG
ncbi:membrane protein [Actibacterium mucosum KCTC 23349]|uniref:Membrane protein n=1 Tax=Actibacterium mucosum KCTC 23349 TaxID=1454373 RepID=A0A037ZFT1_9RHOB|nr:DMT family transporter [Actibacterium mucosum]KAJ55330.1 membrane protein [Actibacterium mucosum KCTC 23349]